MRVKALSNISFYTEASYGYFIMPQRPHNASAASARRRWGGGIERWGCPYVCPSVDKVKIFVQGRISRPINGSKLIFYMRMYLCETSGNIQEP